MKVHKGFRNALVIALAFACGSCAGRPEKGVLTPVSSTAEGASRVPLLIATREPPGPKRRDLFTSFCT